jgi:conjugal transfer pilin signal peptidase TrbI
MARNWLCHSRGAGWVLRQKDLTTAAIALSVVLLGLWLPSLLLVSTSPSLDHRVFLRLALEGHKGQRHGEYLVFSHPGGAHIHQRLHQGNDLLIKLVGCRPGEKLTIENGLVSCQGIPLGEQLETDGQGRKLPHFTYDGIVPPGKYFMIGSHERSYDSRYFGFIDEQQFRYRAIPLW